MTPPSSMPLKIAVVDDNDTLRDLLMSYLQQPGRKVFAADCGETLNQILEKHALDIVVLDLNLPYEDGLSIAKRLRQSHPELRIVMLTARVRPLDRTTGYDSGADVYLTKPTNIAELEAVIRNLAGRRVDSTDTGSHYVLNRQANVLTSPQQEQTVLTATESCLLEQLALAPAEGVETEYLLSQLLRQAQGPLSRENLSVTISRLRKKIEPKSDGEALIQTVRNFGYRLRSPLRVV